jgi:hypothetical protein
MNELYALVRLDEDGNFINFIRKGRNHSISGYDNLIGAKRGLAHSRSNIHGIEKYLIKIVKANSLDIIEY